MSSKFTVRKLDSCDYEQVQQLADILVDCVGGGASVSFMQPFARHRAVAYWNSVAESVHMEERALLVAEDEQGLCGTVQLLLSLPENQPHRADVAKMLVHRRARKQGVATALMQQIEKTAHENLRTLLVLDTVTNSDAARLYEKLGWVKVGDIPNFALYPQGGYCSTTYYYRDLGSV